MFRIQTGFIFVFVALSAFSISAYGSPSIGWPGFAPVHDCISGLSTTCKPVQTKGPLPLGVSVTMNCWAFGDKQQGAYSTDKWFYVTITSGQFSTKKGFVNASWVINQSSVPRCGGNLPTLGTDNYDGSTAACLTALVSINGSSKIWCKNADFKGSNNSLLSSAGYAWRNCTDFVGKRMKVLNWGNANNWDNKARAILTSWAVDKTPHVGDIAQSDSPAPYGHVGIVLQVGTGDKSNQFLIEEYNSGSATVSGVYYGDGLYKKTRWRSISAYTFLRKIK